MAGLMAMQARDPRKRVLVVEDDDNTRLALVHWLEHEYEVTGTRDGIEGLQRAQELPPDVIVTDVWMPRLDGIGMVRCMKKIPELSRVPIIMLTGQTSVKSMLDGISSGIRAYLPKPIDLDILDRKLKSALKSV